MKYEVIKLLTGAEVCGMVEEVGDTLRITAPMVCQLSRLDLTNTLATFIPYTPVSSDSMITIDTEHVLHRSTMSEQYIPYYDEASSKWLTMVETESIPLTNKMPKMEYIKDTINKLVAGMSDDELDRLEEEQFLEEDSLLAPTDPKKIH